MLRISRSPVGPALDWDSIGQAMLKWGFPRTGVSRPGSVEELPAHLRQDLGLLPRQTVPQSPPDLGW